MAAVRDIFFNRIYELIRKGEDLVVVTSDLGAPSLDDLRTFFPERYISVGIAEQSLITVAAGLALAGKKVIAYGLNPFPITRAYDQVRCLMAERNIPVTLCALNAGLCSAESGYTHMPVEDIGMVRMLSNIRVCTPSDETIARKLADATLISDEARYIRFDKTISGTVYKDEEIDFNTGFTVYGEEKKSGVGIVTNGCFVQPLRILAGEYMKKQIPLRIVDLHTLPADRRRLAETLGTFERILTVEEHVLSCGIGSAILEILSDYMLPIPVKRLGLDFSNGYYDVFTDRRYIREDQKLDDQSIRSLIDELVGKELGV